MDTIIRIGTRESQLAVWQATQVKSLFENLGIPAELKLIKSEGDLDLVTPLYAMGVQGVFTRSLDTALLNKRIDIAVHSMKDVPVQLPGGIVQAAVLERASYKDILVLNENWVSTSSNYDALEIKQAIATKNFKPETLGLEPLAIATSSVRRKTQWLHRYPDHNIENLRGNVNTRLRKLEESNWYGAIFAAAGLERIGLRPQNSIDLDWMLPAPAQGAIMIAARSGDALVLDLCQKINNKETADCVKVERDFLSALLGGCSTPISGLAQIENDQLYFKGNIIAPDGTKKIEVEKIFEISEVSEAGKTAAQILLDNGAKDIIAKMNHDK